MAGKQRQPIGIELVKRGVATENDINKLGYSIKVD